MRKMQAQMYSNIKEKEMLLKNILEKKEIKEE